MNDPMSYERILKPPKALKAALPRIGLILIYLLALSVLLVIMFSLSPSPQLLVLVPLAMLLLILPTWKYGFVEYEYIFSGGMLYCAKIFGKRKRRQFAQIDLSRALLIAPNDKENRSRAEQMAPSKIHHAVVDDQANDLWLIVYETAPKETAVLFLHTDETTLRIFRRANPRVTPRTSITH